MSRVIKMRKRAIERWKNEKISRGGVEWVGLSPIAKALAALWHSNSHHAQGFFGLGAQQAAGFRRGVSGFNVHHIAVGIALAALSLLSRRVTSLPTGGAGIPGRCRCFGALSLLIGFQFSLGRLALVHRFGRSWVRVLALARLPVLG